MDQQTPITPGEAAERRGLRAITAQQILMKYLNFFLEKNFKKDKFKISEAWFKNTPALGSAQYWACMPNRDIRNSVKDAFVEAGWQVSWSEYRQTVTWEFTAPKNLEYPELV
ncbi:MAG: hypothetical protein ACW99J_18400 [Candidatus Thorarchaeota archaeon]|jgi:hypothetical protein